MLDFLWALVVWLVQTAGTWALVAGSVFLLFLRLPFSVIAIVRSLLTLALVVALAYRYGFATDGVMGWVDTVVTKYAAMAAVAAVALVVLGLVYVAVGPPGARKARCVRLFLVTSGGDEVPGPSRTCLRWAPRAGSCTGRRRPSAGTRMSSYAFCVPWCWPFPQSFISSSSR
ncbi:hypothetical protein [Streptomyces sp. A30]|uniref:hypothetical protein n=1 Tax=Streptomyces sp. A30 TaxID=2789273 RepID=UPI0039817764